MKTNPPKSLGHSPILYSSMLSISSDCFGCSIDNIIRIIQISEVKKLISNLNIHAGLFFENQDKRKLRFRAAEDWAIPHGRGLPLSTAMPFSLFYCVSLAVSPRHSASPAVQSRLDCTAKQAELMSKSAWIATQNRLYCNVLFSRFYNALTINNIRKLLRFQNFGARQTVLRNFEIWATFFEYLCKDILHKYKKSPVGETR